MKLHDMDQKTLTASPASGSNDVVEETLLILQESQCDPLFELVAAVSKWMFSVLDLLRVF